MCSSTALLLDAHPEDMRLVAGVEGMPLVAGRHLARHRGGPQQRGWGMRQQRSHLLDGDPVDLLLAAGFEV